MSKPHKAPPDAIDSGARTKFWKSDDWPVKGPRKRDLGAEAVEAVEHAVRSSQQVRTVEVPVAVFEPGALVRFAGAIDKLDEVLRCIQTLASDLHVMIRRCDVMTQRQHLPALREPPKRKEGRPTALATGPKKILATLATCHPLTMTPGDLVRITGHAPGTMRTYLPILRAGGLIEETDLGYRLTAGGLALVRQPVEIDEP